MEKVKKLNCSRKARWALLALIWAYALLLNFLTHYVEDDFVYMFQLVTKERLRTVWDIFPSMAIHATNINGRLLCHGLDQLFLLCPKAVFNIVNATAATALIFTLYKLAAGRGEGNAALLAAVALALWRFTPAFGQTFLWQTGSFNYSWAVTLGIFYLCPFVSRFRYDAKPMEALWKKLLFCLLALAVGSWTEITSFVCVLLASVFLLLGRLVKRQSLRTWLWAPVASGAAGFALLVLCPAERSVKMGGVNIAALLEGFMRATSMLQKYGLVLLGVWAVGMALALISRCRREEVWCSAVFAVGAVAANYMMSAAEYYPERCFCTTAVMLVLAVAILVPELARRGRAALCAAAVAVLAVSTAFSLVSGVGAVWKTHAAVSARDDEIAAKKAAGETDLVVPRVTSDNQYCAFWGLWDISAGADFWVNRNVAAYYEVNTIRSP